MKRGQRRSGIDLQLYAQPTTSKMAARKRAQRIIPLTQCLLCGATEHLQRHHPIILSAPSDSAEEMRCLPPNVSSEEVKSDVVRDGVYPRDGAHDGAQEVEMNRVDRLRAGGNGVVPLQGAVALALLLGRVR